VPCWNARNARANAGDDGEFQMNYGDLKIRCGGVDCASCVDCQTKRVSERLDWHRYDEPMLEDEHR
jgi:hypothetical protein